MSVMENYLTVETKDGAMQVYFASEETHDLLPVVIVCQEAFGVNHHIKDVCQRLAKAGYLALAPELFHREGAHITIPYNERSQIMSYLGKLTNENLLEDVKATWQFLEKLPHADQQNVFTLGFCMGGFTSLQAAIKLPLRGAISFYGAGVVHERAGIGFKPFHRELAQTQCPLLLIYGEEDVSIPEGDRFAIKSVLDEAHVPHEILVFGKSDHGFFCDERKTYHASAAQEAWKKTLGWMEKLKV